MLDLGPSPFSLVEFLTIVTASGASRTLSYLDSPSEPLLLSRIESLPRNSLAYLEEDDGSWTSALAARDSDSRDHSDHAPLALTESSRGQCNL